jgi:hypothetical protein
MILKIYVKVCAENIRARPPLASVSSAAADAHAKDLSALREHLIAAAKGLRCVWLANVMGVYLRLLQNRRTPG